MVFSTASRSVGQTSFPEYKELFWCGRQVLAVLWLRVLPVSLWRTRHLSALLPKVTWPVITRPIVTMAQGLLGLANRIVRLKVGCQPWGAGGDRSYYRVSTSERGRIIHQRS